MIEVIWRPAGPLVSASPALPVEALDQFVEAGAVVQWKQDQRPITQIVQVDPLLPRQRIAVGHGHHQRLAAQGQHLDADLAFRRRQAPQPHIDAAFSDLRPLRRRSAFEQLQLHPGWRSRNSRIASVNRSDRAMELA